MSQIFAGPIRLNYRNFPDFTSGKNIRLYFDGQRIFVLKNPRLKPKVIEERRMSSQSPRFELNPCNVSMGFKSRLPPRKVYSVMV